jgi:hypothetical protein
LLPASTNSSNCCSIVTSTGHSSPCQPACLPPPPSSSRNTKSCLPLHCYHPLSQQQHQHQATGHT